MGRCGGMFVSQMLHRGYVFLLLHCLAYLLSISSALPYKHNLIGSSQGCSQGVWMEKDDQFGCFLCDKGQRLNRDEKYCENCTGRLTSCERNVLHSACSKTSCDNEENATSTGQALPIPTRQPTTVTGDKEINLTVVEATAVAVTTGNPKSHMSGTTSGSEQNKESETNSHTEIRPVEDNSKSETSGGLVIVFVVGGIFLFIIVGIPIIWFIVKKRRSEPLSLRKSNAPEAEPVEPGSTDTLLHEDVHRVIET